MTDDTRRGKKKFKRLARRNAVADRKESLIEPAEPASAAVSDAPATPAPDLQRRVFRGNYYLQLASADGGTMILDTPERIALTIAYGQSNSETGGLGKLGHRRRIVTPEIVDPHRAMMFNTGLLGVQGQMLDAETLSGLLPAEEDAQQGESGGSAFLRYTLACSDAIAAPDTVYLYRSAGQGGQPIAQLSPPSPAFGNLLTTVERARLVCGAYRRQVWVPFVLWDHGEADRKRGTAPAEYRAALLALRRELDRRIRASTRQLEPVWTLLTILVAPASRAAQLDCGITLAQISALSEPGLAPVCSPYWFKGAYGFIEGQVVHWSPLGKALLRELGARAGRIVREALAQNPLARLGDPILRSVYDPDIDAGSGGWSLCRVPFETSPRTDEASIRRHGEQISGEVFYAERGLGIVLDHGSARDFGFSWSGAGHIVSVSVDNQGPRPRWIVTLSAASSGVLSYAVSEQEEVFSNAPRMWGNIFDNCAERSIAVPGMTLRQGMLPFSATVD